MSAKKIAEKYQISTNTTTRPKSSKEDGIFAIHKENYNHEKIDKVIFKLQTIIIAGL